MDRTFSLRKLEKNSWKVSFRSGLFEIAIGLVLVVASICHIFDDLRYYFMSLYLIPVLFLILTKKFRCPLQEKKELSSYIIPQREALFTLESREEAPCSLLMLLDGTEIEIETDEQGSLKTLHIPN